MTYIHIYPQLAPEEFKKHDGDKACFCEPQAVVFKSKCFVFHRPPNEDEELVYDKETYGDLPTKYKEFVKSYESRLATKEIKKKPKVEKDPNFEEIPEEKALTGVSRIDSKNTHGWFVRVYKESKTHSKLFSDLKCGGKEKALELAIEHRDEMRKELGLPAFKVVPGLEIEQKPKRLRGPKGKRKKGKRYTVVRNLRKYNKSKTGVVGVYRSSKGEGYEYYMVSYQARSNQRKTKSFSIEKHGEEGAFDLACEFREEYLEKKVYGPRIS